MIIDINAWLGHYPYRQLRGATATELVATMRASQIDCAVVSSIDAVFYNNPQPGNLELAQAVAPYSGQLVPFATINPTYADWEHDLTICQELGMRGVRAFPGYHGYDVGDRNCTALLSAATERGLPVAFSVRLTDRRQRHWLDPIDEIDQRALVRALCAHPDGRFLILNGLAEPEIWSPLVGRRVLIDFSRATVLDIALTPQSFNIPSLIACLGADHLAFGSGIPFNVPHPALLKLELLREPLNVVEALSWRNAARLLALETPST